LQSERLLRGRRTCLPEVRRPVCIEVAEQNGKAHGFLPGRELRLLAFEARNREISIQELLRAVIVPDWVRFSNVSKPATELGQRQPMPMIRSENETVTALNRSRARTIGNKVMKIIGARTLPSLMRNRKVGSVTSSSGGQSVNCHPIVVQNILIRP
jgi:hypothetical protein